MTWLCCGHECKDVCIAFGMKACLVVSPAEGCTRMSGEMESIQVVKM